MGTNKKILIGVSGGPDSMFLLNFLFEKKNNIIAIHVDYNLRKLSKNDVNVVSDFCKKRGIKLYIKNCLKRDFDKYKKYKNKQFIYRKIRYDYFKEVSEMENSNKLYLGHNKDDFIETAIMQEKRSEDYIFYGILKRNYFNNLYIERPLINMFKLEIEKKLVKKKIKFSRDESNNDEKFERNRIRNNLNMVQLKMKKKIYRRYKIKNKTISKFRIKVMKKFELLKDSNFSVNFFNTLNEEVRKKVIYKYLTESDYFINISDQKLNSIIEFINKNSKKSFRIMDNLFLNIKKGNFLIEEKK